MQLKSSCRKKGVAIRVAKGYIYWLKSEARNPRKYPLMSGVLLLFCKDCQCNTEFQVDNGYYECTDCGIQTQELIHTAADDDDVFAAREDGRRTLYSYAIQRKVAKAEVSNGRSLEQSLQEGDQPINFASALRPSASAVATAMRLRYVLGLQLILQKQCETLVERFNVSPAICSIAPSVWLRYVAASRVFEDRWVSDQIALSQESRRNSEKSHVLSALYALRKALPIYSTISISFLSCHIARETVLPTDITDWALNAKLPYLSIFLEMDKYVGPPSASCPVNSRSLFRPVAVLDSWQLETTACKIAERIGLQLPPVNFFALSKRFLQELSLSAETILPEASRVFEWLLPAEMWISSAQYGIPTRVAVMAVLVITLRILYDINGQGVWETSLCGNNEKEVLTNDSDETEMDGNVGSKFCAIDLLSTLESAFGKIEAKHDYTKDVDSYVKYCKDVIFPGITVTVDEDAFIDRFWRFYNNNEDNINGKRFSDEISCSTTSFDLRNKQLKCESNRSSCDSSRSKKAIEKMRLEMEENGFFYLTPIAKTKSKGYITYTRIKLDRELAYVVHADYYILLRAFARLARVDARILQSSVLELERKLVWIEKRIGTYLNCSNDCPVETRDMQLDSE